MPDEILVAPVSLYSSCRSAGGEPCDDFPDCRHSTWTTECPYCNVKMFSKYKNGPYTCAGCDYQAWVSIEYWTEEDVLDG